MKPPPLYTPPTQKKNSILALFFWLRSKALRLMKWLAGLKACCCKGDIQSEEPYAARSQKDQKTHCWEGEGRPRETTRKRKSQIYKTVQPKPLGSIRGDPDQKKTVFLISPNCANVQKKALKAKSLPSGRRGITDSH